MVKYLLFGLGLTAVTSILLYAFSRGRSEWAVGAFIVGLGGSIWSANLLIGYFTELSLTRFGLLWSAIIVAAVVAVILWSFGRVVLDSKYHEIVDWLSSQYIITVMIVIWALVLMLAADSVTLVVLALGLLFSWAVGYLFSRWRHDLKDVGWAGPLAASFSLVAVSAFGGMLSAIAQTSWSLPYGWVVVIGVVGVVSGAWILDKGKSKGYTHWHKKRSFLGD